RSRRRRPDSVSKSFPRRTRPKLPSRFLKAPRFLIGRKPAASPARCRSPSILTPQQEPSCESKGCGAAGNRVRSESKIFMFLFSMLCKSTPCGWQAPFSSKRSRTSGKKASSNDGTTDAHEKPISRRRKYYSVQLAFLCGRRNLAGRRASPVVLVYRHRQGVHSMVRPGRGHPDLPFAGGVLVCL